MDRENLVVTLKKLVSDSSGRIQIGELEAVFRETIASERSEEQLRAEAEREAKLRADREAKREKEYQEVKATVEREFPVRQKLAKLTGRRPEDKTIEELFTWVLIQCPDKADEARKLVGSLRPV